MVVVISGFTGKCDIVEEVTKKVKRKVVCTLSGVYMFSYLKAHEFGNL